MNFTKQHFGVNTRYLLGLLWLYLNVKYRIVRISICVCWGWQHGSCFSPWSQYVSPDIGGDYTIIQIFLFQTDQMISKTRKMLFVEKNKPLIYFLIVAFPGKPKTNWNPIFVISSADDVIIYRPLNYIFSSYYWHDQTFWSHMDCLFDTIIRVME